MADSGSSQSNNALVLSCMDLRVVDDIVAYFNAQRRESGGSLQNQFDFVTFAGAALGASTPLKEHWGRMFWEHLDLAIGLHDIKKVYIVEHQDCGAYKKLVQPETDRAVIGDWSRCQDEEAIHHRVASALRDEIKKRHGDALGVELLYAALKEKGSLDAEIRPLTG